MKRTTLIFCLLFLIFGCASHNIPIPSFTQGTGSKIALKSISIKDRTSDPSFDSKRKLPFFGDLQAPIKQETPFSKIVSNDIDAYFQKSQSSGHGLSVQIQIADPYWTFAAEQRIPVLGLFALDMDVEYGVYLRIQLEVEQNNKVLRTYLYDKVIKTTGKNATGKDIEEGYQKLISTYRQDFFQQLDREFVERYF